jgi:hypothetical protein
MSSFPGEVRFAFLRIKKMHPGWGAAVARLRVAEGLGVAETSLPCISTIEKYWAQFKKRLYRHYTTQPPAPKRARGEKPTEPHQRWQADFKESISVKGLKHKVDVLNIRDEATPVKIGSFVFPASKCTGRDMQAAFRQAFERWGLCDRVQTDRDKRVIYSRHAYPFPSLFVLWLAGLGIAHDIAPSASQNGCAERYNRTWYQRVVLGRCLPDLETLQQISDEELALMNTKLPSKGRDCAGRPPLTAYPQAQQPRRTYSKATELEIFSLQKVYDYLGSLFWWRRVNMPGQITLGDQRYGVGRQSIGEDVCITFDAREAVFMIADTQQKVIKSCQPKNLSVASITGIDPDTS